MSLNEKIKTAKARATVNKRQLKVGLNRGRLTVLPPGYKFPSMTCHQLFHNWFIGNIKENTPAFKSLTSKDLYHVKGGKAMRAKMEGFMMRVKEIADETQASSRISWPINLSNVSVSKITELWGDIGPKLYEKYGLTNQARNSENSWRTMYNNMLEYEAKNGIASRKKRKADN